MQAWADAGLDDNGLRDLQPVLHEEFGLLVQEAYHEANSWLVSQHVLPDIDLRPLIRRTRSGSNTAYAGLVQEETRLMTRSGAPGGGATDAHGPGGDQRDGGAVAPEPHGRAPGAALRRDRPRRPAAAHRFAGARRSHRPGPAGLQRRIDRGEAGSATATVSPALLEELNLRKQALKRAAETPAERATIEIVALLFQSILTEERIPSAVRVWFARLQMPVLRVAVGEPDFFATVDHPARRLIDRMGACVMGFDASPARSAMRSRGEIKRVVQVVEAYPTPAGASSRPC
jgi:hypothetical protein